MSEKKPFYRFGRRGSILATLGIMWMIRGLTLPAGPGRLLPDEAILYELWLSLDARIVAWMLTGAVAFILSRSIKSQKFGWAVICVMPFERAIGHAWSFICWVVPGAPGGEYWSGLLSLYWVGLIIMLFIVSRWPEVEVEVRGKGNELAIQRHS